MLNLALTGNHQNGWPLGRISNVIGDKSTGKTLLAIEAATLALKYPPRGIKMNATYYEAEAAFDQEYAASLGMPVDEVDFREGASVEDLYNVLLEKCESTKKNEGHIVIVDSMDALDSEKELEKEIDAGSYSMEKQKKLGHLFKRLVGKIQEANMHLMIISQIRENITTIPYAPKWRRAGGKALDFYATHLVWLAETKKNKDKKHNRVVSLDITANITKNKVAAQYREVMFPLVFGYGVDDIASLVAFCSNKNIASKYRIKKAGGWVAMPGSTDKFQGVEELISVIEGTPELYQVLVELAQGAWTEIEKEIKLVRKDKVALLTGVGTQPVLENKEYDESAEDEDEIVPEEVEERKTERKFRRLTDD